MPGPMIARLRTQLHMSVQLCSIHTVHTHIRCHVECWGVDVCKFDPRCLDIVVGSAIGISSCLTRALGYVSPFGARNLKSLSWDLPNSSERIHRSCPETPSPASSSSSRWRAACRALRISGSSHLAIHEFVWKESKHPVNDGVLSPTRGKARISRHGTSRKPRA